jgi:hypothetical protein
MGWFWWFILMVVRHWFHMVVVPVAIGCHGMVLVVHPELLELMRAPLSLRPRVRCHSRSDCSRHLAS